MATPYKKRKDEGNKSRAYNYLTKEKGFKPHVAAGILGNFMHESADPNLNVKAYNPDDLGLPSYGLAQWRGDRRERLLNRMGDRADTLEGQLDYMVWELNNTEKRAKEKLQEAKTAEDAALIFSKYYERPHKDYAHNDRRINYAKDIYTSFNQTQDKEQNFYNNPANMAGGVNYLGADVKEEAKVETQVPIWKTERKQDNTNVAQQDYSRLNAELQEQNRLLKESLENQQRQQEAKSKAEIAQAKLNEKTRQRDFIKDLILNTGVDYVERAPRESVYANQPQQQVYQDGGEVKPTSELERYIEDLSNYRPLDSEETANTVRNVGYNLYSYFGGTKDEQLQESPYRPSIKGEEGKKYYYRPGMREDVYRDLTSEKVMKDYNHSGKFSDIHKALKANGEDREHNAEESFSKNKVGYKGMYNLGNPQSINAAQFNLGRYTVDAGEDERGRYISFFDQYDWNGFQKGEPIPFYDRIYEEEWDTYKSK